MVEWLAGNRIKGTSTERTTTSGFNPVAGGWKEVARHTLGSNANPILASSIPDKKYYMVLYHTKHSSGSWNQPRIRFGNGSTDAGSNYAQRYAFDYSSDTPTAPNTYFLGWAGSGNNPNQPLFGMFYVANKSDKEKLVIHHATDNDATGTADAPRSVEQVAKWTNTSNVLDRIELNSASGSSNFTSGDEVVVLGWDPDDTHTTNFWEQLGTATASGSSNTLSTSITSKKYLWIQGYTENTSGSVCPRVGYSSLSNSDYATRLSSNGGSQDVSTGATEITGLTSTTPIFWNMFIKNISGDEKLIIWNVARQNTAGAGNEPNRVEGRSKWVNTSNQIDTIGFVSTTGGSTINSNSFITVWGSN